MSKGLTLRPRLEELRDKVASENGHHVVVVVVVVVVVNSASISVGTRVPTFRTNQMRTASTKLVWSLVFIGVNTQILYLSYSSSKFSSRGVRIYTIIAKYMLGCEPPCRIAVTTSMITFLVTGIPMELKALFPTVTGWGGNFQSICPNFNSEHELFGGIQLSYKLGVVQLKMPVTTRIVTFLGSARS